jgi:hypothetical protein
MGNSKWLLTENAVVKGGRGRCDCSGEVTANLSLDFDPNAVKLLQLRPSDFFSLFNVTVLKVLKGTLIKSPAWTAISHQRGC